MNSTLEVLKQIESLGPYRIVLPFGLLLGSLIAAKLFRVPLALVLIFGALPLAAPFINLPFATELQRDHPLLFVGGGWLILLALVVGRYLAKVLLGAANPTSSLGGVFSIGTAACVLVVSILVINPALLETHFPGWKGSLGLALVSFSLLAFTLSCFRFLRAGALIVFWAGLCAVIGSEVFLNKLPQEYLSQEFEQLSPLFKSLKLVSEAGYQNKGSRSDKFVVAILGGSQTIGSGAYPHHLAQLLSRSDSAQKIQVQSYGASRATIDSMQRMLINDVLPKLPEVVIISGWFDDYLEAKDRGNLAANPANASPQNSPQTGQQLISAISKLSLVKATKNALGIADTNQTESAVEGGVERYRRGLTEMTRLVKKAGAIPILFTEPVVRRGHETEYAIYDRMTQSVAVDQDAGFVSMDTQSPEYDFLFEGENVLSARGEAVVSKHLGNAVMSARAAHGHDSMLAKALESIRTAASSIIIPTKELKNLVTVSFEREQPRGPYRAEFAINDTMIHEQQYGLDESARASFKIPSEYAKYPAVKLSVKATSQDGSVSNLDAGVVDVRSEDGMLIAGN